VRTASGEKKKVVSEVLRKYDACVKYDDFSDTTTPGHNSTNLEAEIFFGNEISLIYSQHSADYFIIL
jgi:hypothetical protein